MQPDNPLRVLVVGAGGREHTLVHFCRQSRWCAEIMAAPGNAGMASEARVFPIAADDIDGLTRLAVSESVDLVIIGPEVPLGLGLTDALAGAGIPAFGPNQQAARLEASKSFTKKLLLKHGIPTARARFFDTTGPAIEYLDDHPLPVVIKADGLAAGKGVIVAGTHEEAREAVRNMLENDAFGPSGRQILIEECLEGVEASIHLLVTGDEYSLLPVSQDHKQIGEKDTGPNTGGMGTYSPAEIIGPAAMQQVLDSIAGPSVRAIADEGLDFRGILFIGIMLTESGPKVIEFNVRFGDPETQVILPRLDTDPLLLFYQCANGYPPGPVAEKPDLHAMCVVLSAAGYPGPYRKGDPISLPSPLPPDVRIFHAGTRKDNGQLLTAGGRVLGVTAWADNLERAAREAYRIADQVRFEGKYYRKDIGAKQLNR